MMPCVRIAERIAMTSHTLIARGLKAAPLVMLLGLGASPALADNPFTGMVGQWNGKGIVTYASGTKERLTCKVRYDMQTDDESILQTLRCASDSYKFQINAFYRNTDGKLNGHWEELTLQISGSISGSVSDTGKITGNLKGPGFQASVLVDTKGNTQSVDIASENQDIRSVSVSVKR
jgi:hypothetical protein